MTDQRRSQLQSRTRVFNIIFAAMLVCETLHVAEMILKEGAADRAPLAGLVVLFLFWWNRHKMVRQQVAWIRKAAVWTYAIYINTRLAVGVLVYSTIHAPRVVQLGFVAPYALVGPGCISLCGMVCGLRPMRDVLLLVLGTLPMCGLHLASVLLPRCPNTFNNYITTVFLTTLIGCCASYGFELNLRRRWMHFPDEGTATLATSCQQQLAIVPSIQYLSLCFVDGEDEHSYMRGDIFTYRGIHRFLVCIYFLLATCGGVALYFQPALHRQELGLVHTLLMAMFCALQAFTNHGFHKSFDSFKLRLAGFYVVAVIVNWRLFVGTGLVSHSGSDSTQLKSTLSILTKVNSIQPTIQEGNPLPYAILGPFFLNNIGMLLGLRAMKDCSPVVLLTTGVGVFHISCTMKDAARFIYQLMLVSVSIFDIITRRDSEKDQRRRWFLSRRSNEAHTDEL